jgi:hypothetical protein
VGVDQRGAAVAENVGFKIENAERFPAYIYSGFPDDDPYDTEVKRGGPYFETLREAGFRVTRLPPGPVSEIPIVQPWTFIFVPVPFTDVSPHIEQLTTLSCSVVFDCHFPIMQLERVQTPDNDIFLQVIESKEVILANLAKACAVTVPHTEWAAELATVNPRVWWLPDIEAEDDEASIIKFASKFMEIAVATQQLCFAARRTETGDHD